MKYLKSIIYISVITCIVTVCLIGAIIVKNKLYRFNQRVSMILNMQDKIFDIVIHNNLIANNYSIFSLQDQLHFKNEKRLLFIGHIYPQNSFTYKTKPQFNNKENPIEILRNFEATINPLKIIFGGDNLYESTNESLKILLNLKSKIPKSKFVVGNHDMYGCCSCNAYNLPDDFPEMFKKIYGKLYSFEIIHDVCLIYLHTSTGKTSSCESGPVCFKGKQRLFLEKLLNKAKYKYALLFMHHALWKYNNDWIEEILPLLKKGRVKAVFAGDESPLDVHLIDSIPHYHTGWSKTDGLPPEWLSIKLKNDSISVDHHKIFKGKHYLRKNKKNGNR